MVSLSEKDYVIVNVRIYLQNVAEKFLNHYYWSTTETPYFPMKILVSPMNILGSEI